MRTGVLLAVLVGVLACAAALPGGASAGTVDAGAIRAVTTNDRWSLTLEDADGQPILRERSATGIGPAGTIGFRSLGIWQHATSVASQRSEGDALIAVLKTTDPSRRIEVRLEPDGEGVIALDARVLGPGLAPGALGIGFTAPAAERYVGFGERSNGVAQSGVVENYVSDGPYQLEEYPALNLFVPPWGLRTRADATYFPVPWLLSTAGYGVLVDNPETSRFRVRSGATDAWSVEVARPPLLELGGLLADPPKRLSMRFFAGPDPADALRRFTRETGRQPVPQAPWVYGPWYQAGNESGELDALRAADAPVSVLQTSLHYLPCGDHRGIEDAQPPRTAAAHDRGAAIVTYFNPMVCEQYGAAFGPAAAAGALTRNASGAPYIYRYATSLETSFIVGQYDFFRQAGRDHYALRLQEAIDHGYDGWMEDFGEYTPLDSVSGEPGAEIDGTRAHNPYPTRYHCAAFDAVASAPRPIVRFQRSGWTGSARCATVVWGGDPTTGWGFDGLESAITQTLTMGMSGISVWGSDIGGFFALGLNQLDDELLTRWVQFGALSGVMRTQRNGVALPSKPRPQVSDPGQIANWRRYTKLRTQLYPYLVAAQSDYVESGMPLTRHMALAFPGDAALVARDDQYMFGDDLLAAPIVTPGATEREVGVPAGTWIDLWRSVAYEPASGGLELGAATTVPGGATATVPAPLTELPLLVRAGATLPLLPRDVDTLADYGGAGITKLSDRSDQLELIAFPRGDSASSFYEDEELASSEGSGRWTLEIDGTSERTYDLQASLATLEEPFIPCKVTLDGTDIPTSEWAYFPETGVLEAAFRTTAGTLAVSACARGGGQVGGAAQGPAAQGRVPTCAGEPATIAGTSGPDRLLGTPGDDVIAAGRGNDRVRGRAGDDLICGGRGDDRLRGGRDDDRLRGGRDDDRLRGGAGSDRCVGSAGADTARHCERGRA